MEKLVVLLIACFAAIGCGGHDCIDNVDCTTGHHFSASSCTCVADPGVDLSASNADLAQECSSSCEGGGGGCPSMCPGGCSSGELCCAYSGGACLLDDAGQCESNGGFSCSTAVSPGVCPNRCYP